MKNINKLNLIWKKIVMTVLLITILGGSFSFQSEAVVDTAIDVVSFGASATSCAAVPNFWNCGSMVWDGVSIFVPFAPGSWVLKAGGKVIDRSSSFKTLFATPKLTKVTFKAAKTIDDVAKLRGVAIGKYSIIASKWSIRYVTEAHHIIEKRFAKILGFDLNKMNAISVDVVLHRLITAKWKKEIPYHIDYSKLTRKQLKKAIENVYEDMPILKNYALSELAKSKIK